MMTTRYLPMIFWAITYTSFSAIVLTMYYCINKKAPKAADLFLFLTLTVVMGIRCNCGSDYHNYYLMYNTSTSWYSSLTDIFFVKFQNGYMVLSYIVKSLFQSEFAIFIIVAAFVNGVYIYIIRKRSFNVVLSASCWMFLGFFQMTSNILKQTISMTFIVLAYDALTDKKWGRFLFFGFLATWFHSSSILIFLLIIFGRIIPFNTKKISCWIILGIIGSFLIGPALSFIYYLLPNFKYAMYIKNFVNGQAFDLKLQLGGILISIFYITGVKLSLLKAPMIGKLNSFYSGILPQLMLCIPISILGMRYFIFNRLAYTGFQFLIFTIPFSVYIKGFSNPSKLFTKRLIVCMLCFCFLFSILSAENNYYSYSTIFNDLPLSVLDFVQKYQN